MGKIITIIVVVVKASAAAAGVEAVKGAVKRRAGAGLLIELCDLNGEGCVFTIYLH